MKSFEVYFDKYMSTLCEKNPDPSHDISHVRRVVAIAKKLATSENADVKIVVPAAYLHDCVYISKDDKRRKQASQISADKALELLTEWEYPTEYIPAIQHCISAHSFSANIQTESIEARVVQDADRLDAMGAIGIYRCLAFSGVVKRPLYAPDDPYCEDRDPDDSKYTLDHFFTKLLHLQERLNTESAKQEGTIRLQTMRMYLGALKKELV